MAAIWPVIASRKRPDWLTKQLAVLLPQLQGPEKIVIVADGCKATESAVTAVNDKRLVLLPLRRQVGSDRARRAANAFVPTNAVVAELDDHDIVEPELLAELRACFEDPEALFAYCDAWITDLAGRFKKENIKQDGTSAVLRGACWGLRAYRRWACDMIGGRPLDFWPANGMALGCAIQFLGGPESVRHINKFLITIMTTPDSVSIEHKAEQDEQASRIGRMMLDGAWNLPYLMLGGPSGVAADAHRDHEVMKPLRVAAQENTARASAGSAPPREAYRPHVLVVTRMLGRGYGGGELSMLGMIKRLHGMGHRITVLYNQDAGSEPYRADWFDAVCYERETLHRRAQEIVREINPDVIVANQNDQPLIIEAAQWNKIPVVLVVQFWRHILAHCNTAGWNALHERPKLPAHRLDDIGLGMLARSDAIVANSAWSSEIISLAMDGRTPDAICHPPIDPERVKITGAREPRYVVCPSVQLGKGAMVFLDLAERNPDVEFLLLMGDARHMAHGEPVKKAHSLPNVTLESAWRADMQEVYRTCKVMFIGTNTCESFCRVAAESRLNGIPLLVSDAGHLPSFIENGTEGVVVHRHALWQDWNAGLHKALTLTPEPDAKWVEDQTPAFAEVVNHVRRMPDVAWLMMRAPGIKASGEYYGAGLGLATPAHGTDTATLSKFGLVVCPGMYSADLADALKTKLAFCWCSHMAQMDTNRHEAAGLMRVVDHVKGRADRWLFLTSKPDVLAWRARLKDQVRWFPPYYVWPPAKPVSKMTGRHVFMPGPYVARKNIYSAVGACAIAGAELHVTSWIHKKDHEAGGLVDLANRMGVVLHVHDCPEQADVRHVAAQAGACIMPSMAETYCYAAAECVAGNTPVVGWAGIPVLQGYAPCLAADPTDVACLADRLQDVLKDSKKHATEQRRVVEQTVEVRNAAAHATLLEVLNA